MSGLEPRPVVGKVRGKGAGKQCFIILDYRPTKLSLSSTATVLSVLGQWNVPWSLKEGSRSTW
jgi:hypothetical protein